MVEAAKDGVTGEIKDFLIQHQEDFKLIVEIGTHFGNDTIEIRKLFPKSEIICFEPDPRNVSVVKIY